MKKSNEIKDALLAVAEQNPDRKLMPSAVVKAARDPRSPLHPRFTWDDSKAAHEHRLWQARELIASVEIVADNRFESSPVFTSLQCDRSSGGYRLMDDVLSNRKLRQQMLITAEGELKAMQFRYDRFKELARIIEYAVAKVHSKIKPPKMNGKTHKPLTTRRTAT